MNTLFIKIIFTTITLYILFYCLSYAKFEFVEKKNLFACISVCLLSFSGIIFSNIVFWISNI